MAPPPDDDAFAAAVAAALQPHVPPGRAAALARFCVVLRASNRRLNLTAVTDVRGMAQRHVLDSLLALPVLDGDGPLLDLGSGGGLPGLPLALVLPQRPVVLVESRQRKAEALRDMIRQLDLGPRVQVVADRAEAWLANHAVDTVITRAVGPVARQLKLLAPVRGSFRRLVLMKGPAGVEELEAARPRLAGWGFSEPRQVFAALPEDAGQRLLLVFEP